jgi:uncharacterized repeat protein (TIGR03803 family)
MPTDAIPVRRSSSGWMSTAVLFAALALALSASAQTETTLYNLNGTTDGVYPRGGVVFDSAGNLYGTSLYGGNFDCRNTDNGCGAVWEISPSPGGAWTETVIHTFSDGDDGATPYASVVPDAAGNIYGSAAFGGNKTATNCAPSGCGVIFKFSPGSGGPWTETILHAFSGGRDGAVPFSGVIFDSAGNLYGTTASGGNLAAANCAPYGCGVVFELSPTSTGWKETVLHSFSGARDGGTPFGRLVLDAAGNLYGTTTTGGETTGCSCGVVFKLSPVAGGWQETIIHTFTGINGGDPQGALIFDPSGNLYGTTATGGENFGCDGEGCGTVFELSPTVTGPWIPTRIHEFTDKNTSNGFYPIGGLARDSAGNLYGEASEGGPSNDGLVFKLSLVSGVWQESKTFSFNNIDGADPMGGLIFDSSGNLYGTATGGPHGGGVVFEIVP